jgi:hypothetical protein
MMYSQEPGSDRPSKLPHLRTAWRKVCWGEVVGVGGVAGQTPSKRMDLRALDLEKAFEVGRNGDGLGRQA